MRALDKYSSPVVALDLDDEDVLDRLNAAYNDEHERWSVRRMPAHPKSDLYNRYELVHIVDDTQKEVITLTRAECKNYSDADSWLRTYRGRACMRAVLEALR